VAAPIGEAEPHQSFNQLSAGDLWNRGHQAAVLR